MITNEIANIVWNLQRTTPKAAKVTSQDAVSYPPNEESAQLNETLGRQTGTPGSFNEHSLVWWSKRGSRSRNYCNEHDDLLTIYPF